MNISRWQSIILWQIRDVLFLTMLGIIIGIASVIAIVSVGEGTKNQMNSEIDDIGGGQIAISVSDEHRQTRSGSLRMMWKQSGR